MTINARSIQQGQESVLIEWTSTDVDPPLGWTLTREINAGGASTLVADLAGGLRSFLDALGGLTIGDSVEYVVTDNSTAVSGTTPLLTVQDLALPPEFGPVDPLATSPRYTTVLDVKGRLRIPPANVDFDDRIVQAIVSGEYGIDAELGRSFPDPTPEGQILGIPVAVVEAATSIAVSIYKAGDAPTGIAGSDDFIGTLDVSEIVRAGMNRNPILKGFKVSWGVA